MEAHSPEVSRPPGLALLAVTGSSIAGLLAMRLDYPELLSAMTGPDELLVGAILVALLAVAGAVWMVKTLRVLEQQRWSWRILDAPTVVLVGATVYWLSAG